MIDPQALAEFNAGIARARLHARVLPIATARGYVPWCAGDCGRRLRHVDTGKTCAFCVSAAATRRAS